MKLSHMLLMAFVATVVAFAQSAKSNPIPSPQQTKAKQTQIKETKVNNSELEVKALVSLPASNSRASRTSFIWTSGGSKSMRKGKLLNLQTHKG